MAAPAAVGGGGSSTGSDSGDDSSSDDDQGVQYDMGAYDIQTPPLADDHVGHHLHCPPMTVMDITDPTCNCGALHRDPCIIGPGGESYDMMQEALETAQSLSADPLSGGCNDRGRSTNHLNRKLLFQRLAYVFGFRSSPKLNNK